jgi:hypothetical protein
MATVASVKARSRARRRSKEFTGGLRGRREKTVPRAQRPAGKTEKS